MSRQSLGRFSIILSLFTLAGLLWWTTSMLPTVDEFFPWVLFCLLIVFTNTFSVPLGTGLVSLLPMTVITAYLVLGPVLACWAAFIGGWLYGWVRHRYAEQLGLHSRVGWIGEIGLAALNATMYTAGILAGGAVYQAMGGTTPLTEVDFTFILPLALLSLTFLGVNHLVAGSYIALSSRTRWRLYIRSLPQLILFELPPVGLAPLMASRKFSSRR